MKYQSLNEYRKRFRLKPYASFEELTGERNFFEESKSNGNSREVERDLSKGKNFIFFGAVFYIGCMSVFVTFTGEKEMAAGLEALYGDIDAMELYPALLVEKPRPDAIFGETMVEMGAPFSLKGLMGNPICSPDYWKPSTFGGEVGFKIINTASIRSLICNNVKGCPFTAFSVQDPQLTKTVTINASSSHSGLDDINPTVLLKERSTEL